jgi:hypothetical protein
MGKRSVYCKDCKVEIFADVNMVMVKDELWNKICDTKEDMICDCCMEKRLGRPITPADFKSPSMGYSIIPCNYFWLVDKKERRDKILEVVKKHISKIKGIYKKIFEQETEQALFEIAQQANTNQSSRIGAEKAVGKTIVKMALKLYPFAKIGHFYFCSVCNSTKNPNCPGCNQL